MSAISDNEPLQSQADNSADPNIDEFLRLQKEIKNAERTRGKWRKYAQRCYDYVAGHQWDEDDKAKLDEEHRPAIVFNRTAPLVKAVCGLEVNNRQSVVYLPRKVVESGETDSVTDTAKWIRDECYADDEESTAFRDMAICGEGWTETRMDFDENPTGKVVKERIDPMEMGINKGACRSNYADARMMYRIRKMIPADVRALLGLSTDPNSPDYLNDAALDASPWLPDSMGTPADGGKANKRDYPKSTRTGVVQPGRLDEVKVVQCQYWMRVPVHMVATAEDTKPQQMDEATWQAFQARTAALAEAGTPVEFKHAVVTKKVFYQCFIGIRILDRQPMTMGMFQFSPMTGDRDTKENWFVGMVGDMIDPQMWSNKWLSQTMNIMNSNAKGGIIAETDAFANPTKAEKEWADPTKIVWAKPGGIAKNKIKERTPMPLPTGLDQLMMFAISSIRDVTGINLELLGQADREQAASLEQQRRQSAMTILATMFDSLRKYRRRDGKLLLQFIWLLPEGTLVRVLDQGQYKYLPFFKAGKQIEDYDIIIDQAPSSPDQKQFVWGITSQILSMNILPPPAIVALLKYSPYPESVVQEIREALGVDGQIPPEQLQQRLQQAEQALQVMEGKLKEEMDKSKELQNSKTIDMLNTLIDEYKAQTERLNAEWQARIKAADTVVKANTAGAKTSEGGGPSDIPPVGDTSFVPLPAMGGADDALHQKVDQLSAAVGQILQAIGGQQQAAPAQPPVDDGSGAGMTEGM